MRPRPSREWVVSELERVGVRLVTGRIGKDKDDLETDGHDDDHLFDGDDDEDDDDIYSEPTRQPSRFQPTGFFSERPEHRQYREYSITSFPGGSLSHERPDNLQYREESMSSTHLSAIDVEHGRPTDVDWKREGAPQRRNASTGIALLDAGVSSVKDNDSSKGYQSQDQQVLPPAYRPFVGGGAAAAYNVLKEDHYMKLAAQKKAAANFAGSRATTGVGSDAAQHSERPTPLMDHSLTTASLPVMKPQGITDVHRHYEMLKVHHMNLLKEIQETTIMMNIFQQQMLAQQQEKKHDDLVRQQLLQQQLKQKQQLALSNMSAQQHGFDNHSYNQATKKIDSWKPKDSDLNRTNMPANASRITEVSLSNHGLKGLSTSTDFMNHGNFSASGHAKQAKKARKSTPSSNLTGEEESQRAQRFQLEHLKAEILEKQALLAAMSQNVANPNQVQESTTREANHDDQNTTNDTVVNL